MRGKRGRKENHSWSVKKLREEDRRRLNGMKKKERERDMSEKGRRVYHPLMAPA